MTAVTTSLRSSFLQLLLLCVTVAGVVTAVAADRAEGSYDAGLRIIRDEGFGSIDLAIDNFRDAVKAMPTDIQARLALADALVMKYELSEKKEADWLSEARLSVEEVLRLRPGHPSAYFSMANVLLDLGKEEDGARYLKKAVLASPEDEKINAGYFSWLLANSRVDDAIRFAAESGKANEAGMARFYGELLLGAGRPVEALSYLQRVTAKGSKDTGLELSIADALRLSGKHADALAKYESVMNAGAEGAARAFFGASCCLAETGQLEKAVALLQKYLTVNSDDVSAMNNLAVILEKLGRNEEAAKVWKKLAAEESATPEQRKRAEKFMAGKEKAGH